MEISNGCKKGCKERREEGCEEGRREEGRRQEGSEEGRQEIRSSLVLGGIEWKEAGALAPASFFSSINRRHPSPRDVCVRQHCAADLPNRYREYLASASSISRSINAA
jgi:hypothetical protein